MRSLATDLSCFCEIFFYVPLRLSLQETTVLRNHSVRPGQFFVFFERVTIAKLAVRDDGSDVAGRRRRHMLVPLTHAGRFQRTSGVTSALKLTDLSRSPLGYPFTLTYQDETDYRNLEDDLLPAKSPLRADGVVDEDSVLVARISEDDALAATRPPERTRCRGDHSAATVNADDAFHLPLRTKLTVCLGELLHRPVRRQLSCRNDFAEELSEATYNKLVGLPPPVEVGYVRPQIRASIGS